MIFDKIIVITMEKNKNRQKYCKNIMDKLGWKFEFFYAKPHPNGGTWGCYHSHMMVIQYCIIHNFNYVLICEDDLKPTKDFSSDLFNKSISFINNNKKWDIFSFGYTICSSMNGIHFTDNLLSSKIEPNIYRIRACLTHCYAIQRSTYKKVYKILKDNYKPSNNSFEHIDQLYSKKCRMYGISPILFDQKWCLETDNNLNNLFEKYIRKLSCFGDKNNIIPLTSNIIYSSKTFYLYILIFLSPIFMIWYIKKMNNKK